MTNQNNQQMEGQELDCTNTVMKQKLKQTIRKALTLDTANHQVEAQVGGEESDTLGIHCFLRNSQSCTCSSKDTQGIKNCKSHGMIWIHE